MAIASGLNEGRSPYPIQVEAPPPQLAPEVAAPKMQREEPEVSQERRALVKRLIEDVKNDEKYHKPAFTRMKEDMSFLAGKQWDNQTEDDDRYVLNICIQHVLNRTAALYARDPKATAKRKPRMVFKIWDEKMESIQKAQQEIAMYQQQTEAMPPEQMALAPKPMAALALLEDMKQGAERILYQKRVAKTLEAVYAYAQSEIEPTFKESMKQLVRRVLATGVAYVDLGYHRAMARTPETERKIGDLSERLAVLERLTADLEDGESQPDSADAEELRLALGELQREEEVLVREGMTWDFPASTSVIPDRMTRHLKGFVGARRVTRKFLMTADRIKETYSIDLGKNFTRYQTLDTPTSSVWVSSEPEQIDALACVYVMQHRGDGLIYTMVDGYPDFLEEPRAPTADVEGFWTIQAITFNDIENETSLFPPSDSRLLRHPQREYNRTMQARRQHRIASRPLYAAGQGTFGDEDRKSLADHEDHDIIMLGALQPGMKVGDLLGPVEKTAIDPNIYETESIFQDFTRAAGSAEANFGSMSKGSATEASIAEGSRVSSLSSNADDLDEFLSLLARKSSQVMLREYSQQTVAKIAGPGAVWPELKRAEIMEELYLEIEAGSTGRPNKAQDIANLERLAPTLLQIPGISPAWLGRKAVQTLDDRVDLTEALVEGLASIIGINGMQQPGTGDPSTDPTQQGAAGGGNAPSGPGASMGSQPAYTPTDPRTVGGEVAGRS
jgi:hypothetical protein